MITLLSVFRLEDRQTEAVYTVTSTSTVKHPFPKKFYAKQWNS